MQCLYSFDSFCRNSQKFDGFLKFFRKLWPRSGLLHMIYERFCNHLGSRMFLMGFRQLVATSFRAYFSVLLWSSLCCHLSTLTIFLTTFTQIWQHMANPRPRKLQIHLTRARLLKWLNLAIMGILLLHHLQIPQDTVLKLPQDRVTQITLARVCHFRSQGHHC